MGSIKHQQISRKAFSGLLLRLLGHRYSGIALTNSGIELISGTHKEIPFLRLRGPIQQIRSLWFPGVFIPVKGGKDLKVLGITHNEAEEFVSLANEEWRRCFIEQVERVDKKLRMLATLIDRLKEPKRYSSACLIQPFLVLANEVLKELPPEIPEGILPTEQAEMLNGVIGFQKDPHSIRDASIDAFMKTELKMFQKFFDNIETNPLTHEQRVAVLTDEDATLILAGAGSGKTSVIVAKAAYLVRRKIRQPEEILLMAFGKEAAKEMATRIQERTGAAVVTSTFHSLGYKIINEVENGAPALAQHASDDAQFRDLLKNILSNDILSQPDLASLVLKWFSEFYRPYKSEWDFETRDEYYQYVEAHELRTLQGELVRSFEECEIANWLYLNGVAYEYEPNYEHELPENNRKDYTPDFRLTESGVYIEHFGVRKSKGPNGEIEFTTAPSVPCENYLEEMDWKKEVHKKYGTVLIETFSYERVKGRLTEALSKKLQPHVTLNPIPPETVFERLSELGQVDGFTQTLGTFLRHYKSSGVTLAQCRERIERFTDKARGIAFLKIFESVLDAYQNQLGDRIDFEDMIVRATAHVKAGRYQSPYRHLLVDEFQDISEGRARLILALKAQHQEARIFCVGDDWQSIFRFTGSDIHLMRNFGHEFGGVFAGQNGVHKTVDLGRTFRSVDKIALPARSFILKNPSQITKEVVPAGKTEAPAIKVSHYEFGGEKLALETALAQIDASSSCRDNSVLLLGRYHFVKPNNLSEFSSRYTKLSIKFKTVHASKGLEADHVVILRAVSNRMGFPAEIVDDPLLDLVLPEPEEYAHAEERRLFYVALTRARKSVTILADRQKPSSFVRELLVGTEYGVEKLTEAGFAEHQCGACCGRMLIKQSKNGRNYFACEHRYLCGEKLQPCGDCGGDLPIVVEGNPNIFVCSCGAEFLACPVCIDSWLVERKGRYGKFLGCVKYPACEGKQGIRDDD